MKRPRSAALDYLVYAAVRLVVFVIRRLPIGLAYRLADGLASVAYTADKRHRKVADDNLKAAFGTRYDDHERDLLVRQVYGHFCRMVVEMVSLPGRLSRTTWRRLVTLSGHGPAIDRLLTGGPTILVTGHFGNWEMAGYLFGIFGFKTHAIARTLDNPYLERFLKSFREQTGQMLIPKKGGYEQMLEVLKGGGTLSFMADQDAGQRGLYVDFFGRPASTHKAIALLAIEYQAPIIVGGAWRTGPGFRYVVHTEDVIDPADWADQDDQVRYITQRFTASLEKLVEHAPEQYLWLHRRWKHQPQPRKKRSERQAAA